MQRNHCLLRGAAPWFGRHPMTRRCSTLRPERAGLGDAAASYIAPAHCPHEWALSRHAAGLLMPQEAMRSLCTWWRRVQHWRQPGGTRESQAERPIACLSGTPSAAATLLYAPEPPGCPGWLDRASALPALAQSPPGPPERTAAPIVDLCCSERRPPPISARRCRCCRHRRLPSAMADPAAPAAAEQPAAAAAGPGPAQAVLEATAEAAGGPHPMDSTPAAGAAPPGAGGGSGGGAPASGSDEQRKRELEEGETIAIKVTFGERGNATTVPQPGHMGHLHCCCRLLLLPAASRVAGTGARPHLPGPAPRPAPAPGPQASRA